jgi:hypothetical protein
MTFSLYEGKKAYTFGPLRDYLILKFALARLVGIISGSSVCASPSSKLFVEAPVDKNTKDPIEKTLGARRYFQ